MMIRTQAVPYTRDSSCLFAGIADWPWAVFLDSGQPASDQGRYDIISAQPIATVTSSNGLTTLDLPEGKSTSRENPFGLIREALGARSNYGYLPFIGGAIGYSGYGVANYLNSLPDISIDQSGMPDLAYAIYNWALIVDHEKEQSFLISSGDRQIRPELWKELIKVFSTPAPKQQDSGFELVGEIESNLTLDEYATSFDRILKYIKDGDCYQVNYAQKFSANCLGDPWQAYCKLRVINPSPFGAYLNTPFGQILSSSPERFLKVDRGEVETKPIKGTRPRFRDAEMDRQAAIELRESKKDQAENLMIVDLLRNDLGKSCKAGSIKVPELFNVESYATVHHLVSTVTGSLADESDGLSLLSECFPGGSITGAPKYRAMEIIEELEPDPRGVYCGSIGYIGYDGNMDSNIAIRTMVHQAGKITFSAGGGIVADSEMESEYQETFDKASAMLEMLL